MWCGYYGRCLRLALKGSCSCGRRVFDGKEEDGQEGGIGSTYTIRRRNWRVVINTSAESL